MNSVKDRTFDDRKLVPKPLFLLNCDCADFNLNSSHPGIIGSRVDFCLTVNEKLQNASPHSHKLSALLYIPELGLASVLSDSGNSPSVGIRSCDLSLSAFQT